MQRLVERAAGSVQPLSQDIDRDIAERDRDQHLALVGGQPAPAVLPQRREQVTCFGMLVRSGRAVGDQRPARWLQRDLASMPGMLAALPVEDPGDLGVGVVGGRAADQADGVLIGADR